MNIFGLLSFIAGHPLNRAAPVRAIGRFMRWQLASRLIAAPVAVPFVNDSVLVLERGMVGATGNWYCGLHEAEDMAFVLHALRPGDLFADVGANVGSYTVLAGAAVGAEVIAVEPVPATHARLQRNIRMNDIAARAAAYCCGISSAPGELEFIASLDARNRVALPGDGLPTIKVPVTTLDALLGGRAPKVMKIDVEGHEKWVIEGGAQTFGNPALAAVLMETNQSGAKFGVSDEELVALMAGHGFAPFSYDPFARTLRPHLAGAKNTIFVRDAAALEAVCKAAPRFRLINGSI